MTDNTAVGAVPAPGLITVAHLVYALHDLSLLIGVTTAATIVGAFVFGVPCVVLPLSRLRAIKVPANRAFESGRAEEPRAAQRGR